jgi:hypothetical protein
LKKITWLTLLYCIVLLSPSHVYADVSVTFKDYFPLHVGDSWTLTDGNGIVYNHLVTGQEVIDGGNTYKYTNWEGNPEYANLFFGNSGELVVAGLDGVALDVARIINGVDIDNSYVDILYSIEGLVSTPAGDFEQVIKEKIYSKVSGSATITREQYFAKGIGLIKDVNFIGDDGTGEYLYTALLTSYNIASDPDPATSVPEPATMLLFGTGIAGLIMARRKKKA